MKHCLKVPRRRKVHPALPFLHGRYWNTNAAGFNGNTAEALSAWNATENGEPPALEPSPACRTLRVPRLSPPTHLLADRPTPTSSLLPAPPPVCACSGTPPRPPPHRTFLLFLPAGDHALMVALLAKLDDAADADFNGEVSRPSSRGRPSSYGAPPRYAQLHLPHMAGQPGAATRGGLLLGRVPRPSHTAAPPTPALPTPPRHTPSLHFLCAPPAGTWRRAWLSRTAPPSPRSPSRPEPCLHGMSY